MDSEQIQPSLAPIGDFAGTAGYAVMPVIAEKYLSDPLVLSKLTERVYQLFLEDMRCQGERVRNYGKQRWL